MKNKYILIATLVALFATVSASAQEGFGTNTPAPSSVVDMVSTNKGALLPRIALTSVTDVATILAPANALTVFNTATAGTGIAAVTPGYYYYSTADTKWIRLSSSADAWQVKGNVGTIRGTNFIGTNDNNDLMFKTNGKYRMHLESNGGLAIGDSTLVYNYQFGGVRVNYYNDNAATGLTTAPNTGISNILDTRIKAGTPSTGSVRSLSTRLTVTADSGATRPSGDMTGASIFAYRTPSNGNTDGTGTISSITGLWISTGNNTGASGTTGDYFGVNLEPVNGGSGTVTNFYGYYMKPFASNTGTVTNKYGVYINNDFTNYFGGKVGIGTGVIAPTNQLHVKATTNPVRFEGLAAGTATDNIVTVDANGVLTKSTGTLAAADLTKDAWIDNAAATRVELGTKSDGTTARTAGTEFVALDNGRVGIGTTTPTETLEIKNDGTSPASVAITEGDTSFGGVYIKDISGANIGSIQGIGTAHPALPLRRGDLELLSRNDMTIWTDNNQRVIVDKTGLVGVNIAAPTNQLHIKATTNPVRFEGLQPGSSSDQIVVADATGVLKTVASVTATPKFFYAPSVVLPTVNTSLPANITYNSGTQVFTADLYAIYNNQFGMTGDIAGAGRSAIKSAGATTLPVQAVASLEYFVTYFDNTVFDPTTINLSATGVLTYKVLPAAVVSEKTYMNIVFKVK